MLSTWLLIPWTYILYPIIWLRQVTEFSSRPYLLPKHQLRAGSGRPDYTTVQSLTEHLWPLAILVQEFAWWVCRQIATTSTQSRRTDEWMWGMQLGDCPFNCCHGLKFALCYSEIHFACVTTGHLPIYQDSVSVALPLTQSTQWPVPQEESPLCGTVTVTLAQVAIEWGSPVKHWHQQCNCSWSVPWWCGGRSSGSAADSGHCGRSLPTEENQA